MIKVLRIFLAVLACAFLTVVSLNSLATANKGSSMDANAVQKKVSKEVPNPILASDSSVQKLFTDINQLPLVDNTEIYKNDDPGSVVTMYLTVREGNVSENTNHTWKEVNDSTNYIFDSIGPDVLPRVEAILQVGDENGPLPDQLGYNVLSTNATVEIRGSSTSLAPQKSYKIELYDSAGTWRGQRTIDLNKHIFDITRVKNKLSFDMMKTMPDMVSLRTQFVHLYVKDETKNPASKAFEDYGLFTQIEQPNKTFLKSHMLDRYGQLYKAIMFEFYRYPDQLRAGDDPLYDEKAFSRVLEIKGNKDHTKLIQMLDDVNNWAIPIKDTFEKYFNQDNYFTWMAFNILIGNTDTNSQNFFLYSPQNSSKWYFMPWDYDGTLLRVNADPATINPTHQGISTYWGDVLHKRVLMVPEYRDKLTAKMEELLDLYTPARINEMLDVYRPVTEPFVSRMPDLLNLPGTIQQYDHAYNMMPDELQKSYQLYQEDLQRPMPFFMGVPENLQQGSFRFSWDEAYDFGAEDITYHFQVAKDWDFKSVLRDETIVNGHQVDVAALPAGTYFWRVVATNASGKSQYSFDYYRDNDRTDHYGMKYLYVTTDGQIMEKQEE